MTHSIVYALDFDGVICDSAVETGVAGWKAASRLWPDMPTQCPPAIVKQFCLVRPVLETGYEAIFVIRLLFNHTPTEDILADFDSLKQTVKRQLAQNTEDLKQLFGQTRDQWIDTDPEDWLANNPLFDGVKKKLTQTLKKTPCYIVTTKQERFVQQILSANDILIPQENIYGLERQLKKDAILLLLIKKHPEQIIHFVEDRLPPLLDAQNHPQLKDIQLYFADWGYNTETDKQSAREHSIPVIGLQDFLVTD